jgi:hypothetical protein
MILSPLLTLLSFDIHSQKLVLDGNCEGVNEMGEGKGR